MLTEETAYSNNTVVKEQTARGSADLNLKVITLLYQTEIPVIVAIVQGNKRKDIFKKCITLINAPEYDHFLDHADNWEELNWFLKRFSLCLC